MLEITLSHLQNGNKPETLGSKEKRERQAISLRAFKLVGFGSPSKRSVMRTELIIHIIHTLGRGLRRGK